MVNIAPCLQGLWPFVYENSPFETMSALEDQNNMKLGHIVKYHNVSFKYNNGPYHTTPS